MAHKIDSQNSRKKLKPRKEPYWHKIAVGQFIGYRKTSPTDGSWTARIRDHDGKQQFHILSPTLSFDEAVQGALKWFGLAAGVSNLKYTVDNAIDDYVDHIKINNSVDASTRTRNVLDKHLSPTLGKIELIKLTTHRLKKWQTSLVRTTGDDEDTRKSKDSANRILNMAKAAFNLAFNAGVVADDKAWRKLKAFKSVSSSRKVFLSDDQIKRLLDVTEKQFHNLILAAIHTGARYGELCNVRAHDLDIVQGTIRLTGKTGSRDCYLSKAGLAFFKLMAKDALPKALLLPKDNGHIWGKSHAHRFMQAAVVAAKLPAGTVFYSLRHYHISKACLSGMPLPALAENCGTSTRMIEKHYAKFMGDDKRAMLNAVELGI